MREARPAGEAGERAARSPQWLTSQGEDGDCVCASELMGVPGPVCVRPACERNGMCDGLCVCDVT